MEGAGEVVEREAVWELHAEFAEECEWGGGALRRDGNRFRGGVCDAVRGVVCDSGGGDCGADDGEDVRERESEERDDGKVLGGLGVDDDEMDGE